jgi:O-antigen/teichoic acid export membrane protein
MAKDWRRRRSPPDEVVHDVSGALGGVVRRGVLISAVSFSFVSIVSVIGTVALARLLSPAEVGIFAGGTVLSVVLLSLAQANLRLALVQRVGDVDEAANTVFWATAAGGLIVTFVTIAAAPVLAYVFGNDLVAAVAVGASGLLLLESLTTVPDGLMQRRFNFLRRLVIDPSRAIAYAVTAVVFAASGFGVWSMVLGQYASLMVWLAGSWSLARWRPGRGRPSVGLWRELVRFSHPIVIWDIVLYARETVQTAIIGRALGPAALGNYRYGSRIGTHAGQAVVEIGSYVLFPAFARLTGDPQRMRVAFLRALRWIWFFAAPTAALVVALGEQTVVVLFGERWHDAGPVVVALAGYGLGLALQAVPTEAIMAHGRSVVFHWISALALVLGIGSIIVLLPWGIVGVGIAVSSTEMMTGVLLLVLAKPLIAYRFSTIVRILLPPALAATAAVVAAHLVSRVTGPITHLPTANALGILGAQAAVLVLCYFVSLTVLDYRLISSLIAKLRARF